MIAKLFKATVSRATVFRTIKAFKETGKTSRKVQVREKTVRTSAMKKRIREKIQRGPSGRWQRRRPCPQQECGCWSESWPLSSHRGGGFEEDLELLEACLSRGANAAEPTPLSDGQSITDWIIQKHCPEEERFPGQDLGGCSLFSPATPAVTQTELGFEATLERNLVDVSYFGEDFPQVKLAVEFQSDHRLRVKLSPLDVERYEVPIDIDPQATRPANPLYDIQFTSEPVFSFKVIRKATGTVLFDSGYGGLTLSSQFLQIGAQLPSDRLYGLGEQEQESFKHDMDWRTWAIFAADQAPNPELNLYGAHPYYTVLENDGNAHSVLFKNSNGADVTLTPKPGLIYRTIGGVLDMYFFLGPTPENVVQQFTGALGRHPVPSYWSLGFHICRWEYNSTQGMREAYDRTLAAGIPLDGQWSDIDIMDRRLDFTYDRSKFGDLPEFIEEIHAQGRRFVAILDPGVPMGESDYLPFAEGSDLGVWVTEAQSGLPIQGKVWPDNPVHFPDFTSSITRDWWIKWIKTWHQDVPWDGIWIDMNEPANFVDGSTTGCEENQWNNPPYVPTHNSSIIRKTLCMDARHSGGSHYDTHSMYGWWEAVASRQGVQEATGERSLLVSRSTFIGGGQNAAHWLGDNFAEWDNLKFSIIGILQFNQFGFPLVGADICGFFGDYNPEMCARWHQLGAFYPFARNHNHKDAIDQDPGVDSIVAPIAKAALEIRYSLLPYLYSLFYEHTLYGSTVFRPLWHEFPTDANVPEIDEQFMWGSALLVSPALQAGQTLVNAYIPNDRWFDFYTTEEVVEGRGQFLEVPAPLERIPLHLRGGSIIPTQEPAMSTELARQTDLYLLVTLDDNQHAEGVLYWDDGKSLDPTWDSHSRVQFSYENNQLNGTVTKNDDASLNDLRIGRISFYGLPTIIARIRFPEGANCDWNQEFAFAQLDCYEKIDPNQDWSMELFFYC
eukprot:maker-scaffold226_size249562-snap-gene-1.14 protein:Tk02729 transcript:maker-scaffold226_size249562-snap-gene-1.14-mRNA-1 annotation:"maltase- intestinal-like"